MSITKDEFKATAIWLRTPDKDRIEVLVEIDGVWHLAIREDYPLSERGTSHIAEGNGAYLWPTVDLG